MAEKKWMIPNTLYTLLKLTIGIVFLYSGITKIAAPLAFSTIIDAYGIIPEATTLPAAMVLASLEIMAGSGLLMEIRGSLTLVSCLLALFMIILYYGIYMGLDIDCGCFGPNDPGSKAFHGLRPALNRDIMMAMGIVYMYIYRNIRGPQPKPIEMSSIYTFIKRRFNHGSKI